MHSKLSLNEVFVKQPWKVALEDADWDPLGLEAATFGLFKHCEANQAVGLRAFADRIDLRWHIQEDVTWERYHLAVHHPLQQLSVVLGLSIRRSLCLCANLRVRDPRLAALVEHHRSLGLLLGWRSLDW